MSYFERNFLGYGRVVINWKICNFTKDLLNPITVTQLNTLHSPEFKILLRNKCEATKWKFLANRKRTSLLLYLDELMNSGNSNYIVKYDMFIKDQINETCLKKSTGKVEIRYYEEKLGRIINYKECLRPHSNRYLYNNQIHIVVYLEIIKKDVDISNLLNTTLSSHYEQIFNNDAYSDFLITTSDDQDIHVHKNILSMRSPVFQAMINSKMIEGSEKKVKIDDIDSKALIELIRFIYSGKVKEIDSIAVDLLYAANKYDIQDLKPLCIESLALNLTKENVLDTLAIADLHQEKALKRFCYDFVKWKYDDIKEHSGWSEFNHQSMKDILDFMMSPILGKKEECTIITNIKRNLHTISPSGAINT